MRRRGSRSVSIVSTSDSASIPSVPYTGSSTPTNSLIETLRSATIYWSYALSNPSWLVYQFYDFAFTVYETLLVGIYQLKALVQGSEETMVQWMSRWWTGDAGEEIGSEVGEDNVELVKKEGGKVRRRRAKPCKSVSRAKDGVTVWMYD
jgi:hypothetical protein